MRLLPIAALAATVFLAFSATGSAEAASTAQEFSAQKRQAAPKQRATTRIKTLCRQAHHATLEEQLAAEAVFMVESQGDAEAAEGIGAFLGKRKADFVALRHTKQDAS